MNARMVLPVLILGLVTYGCSADGGSVTIDIQQALTGQTTAAGTFTMKGAFADAGSTTEELTFGGPLDQPPVPVTFQRTLTGVDGTLVMRGAATLTFTSPTAATLSGQWSVASGTGRYAKMTGEGNLAGNADFGAAPPTAGLIYSGSISR